MDELWNLFEPRSIAIIGASSDRAKLGGRPIHYLKEYGFTGAVYPVNPQYSEIQGLPAFPSVTEVPDEVDHAVIVVPAPSVERALLDCAARRVKVVQILSSGFAEVGERGRVMQERIAEIGRQAGMRLLGPNALGAVSPSNGLMATFSSSMTGLRLRPGNVGFVTQSGAFGSCAYVMALLRGLGLSRAVATGNEVDVDVAECIALLADDPATDVICAAMESCRDGDRLRDALRRAVRAGKPVLIMKVGTTEVGAAAVATHTASLAGDDAAFDAVFAASGAVRPKSIEEMIDLAYVLAKGRIPSNDLVGILTISGGIGVLMADAAIDRGLSLPRLPPDSRERAMAVLPFATGNNPFDMTAQVSSHRSGISAVGEEMVRGTGCGSLLVYLSNTALSPPAFAATQETLLALRSACPETLLLCVMPSEVGVRAALEAEEILVFEDPSRAIAAVAGAVAVRSRWAQLAGPSERSGAAQPLPDLLDEVSAKAYLAASGVPVLEERLCRSPADAARAAEEIGFPVVAKIVSPDVVHKTEVGGVRLGLTDRAAVESAYQELVTNVRRKMPAAVVTGVLIAPMVTDGLETILGVHRDPVFGPMIVFGLGGVMVEVLDDVSLAPVPVSPAAAQRLIDSSRAGRLLDGWRGQPRRDRAALVDAISRLSDLAHRADDIESIDLNPFVVRTSGAAALDAVIVARTPDSR